MVDSIYNADIVNILVLGIDSNLLVTRRQYQG
jgi:hypothetical protein